MSMLVAALVFVPLLAVSLAHFVWSFGGTWPLRSRALLLTSAIGRPAGAAMPSRLVTFGVALALLGAGIVALSLADHESGGLGLTLLGLLLAAIFLARGIAGYTPQWRARFPVEPFATLDRKNYSPLCLIVGAGFLLLVLMRLL